MVIRLTPNGLSVRFLVSAISVSSRSGVIAPQAITPNAAGIGDRGDEVALARSSSSPRPGSRSRSRGTRCRAASAPSRRSCRRRHGRRAASAIIPSPLMLPAPAARRGRRRCGARARRARYIPRGSARDLDLAGGDGEDVDAALGQRLRTSCAAMPGLERMPTPTIATLHDVGVGQRCSSIADLVLAPSRARRRPGPARRAGTVKVRSLVSPSLRRRAGRSCRH